VKSSRLALLSISILTIVFVGGIQHSAATREIPLFLTDGIGTSKYRLVVDLPSEIPEGEGLKIVFTLYLDELPPLKHYSGYVSVTFTLVSEDGRTIARRSVNNRMDAYKVDYIYPGYRWGPYPLTINPDFSLWSGKASLYVTLESEEYVEDPLGVPVIATRPNPTTVSVGEVGLARVFQLLDYLILALPVAAAVSILVYWRMRLWRKAT
jgi:hypothetical protein